MGIRDAIAKALGYRLGKPNVGGLQMIEMQTPPSWTYQHYLRAYGEIGWLYATVNVIAQAVAKTPWHLYQGSREGELNKLSQHPLIALLNKMNPFQSRYQFMYLGTMYKLLVGEQFWQINFNGLAGPKAVKIANKQGQVYQTSGQPAEIWLAPPAYMAVIPSPTEYIDHYEFRRTGMGAPIPFTIDEIIHIKTPNPFNEYRGLSPAQALTVELDTERYASRYQQKLFFNDATPGFILEYPADNIPPQEIRKELMQEWDERHKGFRNRGKTAFLWGGKANTLTMTNRDMDFNKLRLFNRDTILGAYHVPRSILGITEDVNRANAEAAQYTFAMYCVHPELCELREALNKELCPMFGKDLYLDFENPVPEDVLLKTNRAKTLWEVGLVRRNEAREMVDLDPIEGPEGEEFKQPAPSPFEQSPFGEPEKPPKKPKPETEPEEEPEEEEETEKGILPKALFPDDASREEYWKRYVTRVEAYEKPIITAMKTIFEAQQKEAMGNLDRPVSPGTQLVDIAKFREAYAEAVSGTLDRLMLDSIKHGMELVAPQTPHKDLPAIPAVVSQTGLAWIKTRIAWAAEQVGEETAKLLAKALADGFAAGESMLQIADRVSQVFAMSDMRAMRIARTETIAASNIGAVEGYKATGVVDRTQWYTAKERVCEICEELDGQVNPIGHGYMPPIHPSCRCVLLAILTGEVVPEPEKPGAFAE